MMGFVRQFYYLITLRYAQENSFVTMGENKTSDEKEDHYLYPLREGSDHVTRSAPEGQILSDNRSADTYQLLHTKQL